MTAGGDAMAADDLGAFIGRCREFMAAEDEPAAIVHRIAPLMRGGGTFLPEGAVTTFVPNPDHIHVTGVPEGGASAVSLHLYGRNMNSFHIYDLASGSRQRVDVPRYRSR